MASNKPIQEQIFKSRLTITYRTNITGTAEIGPRFRVHLFESVFDPEARFD